MTAEWERESRLSDNFSKVPHGLWTCDLSHGAKCLLGWLHSHTSNYLATLSTRRIRDEFGAGGSAGRWLLELEAAGFVKVISEKNRKRYRLMAAPWDSLALRPKREKADDETAQNGPTRNGTTQHGPQTDPKWADNRPEMGTIEDHVEDQPEDHSLAHASVSTTDDVARHGFEHWWHAYPRKVGKGAALKRWRAMSSKQRAEALDALPDHVRHWQTQRTEVRFIPHPATWLSQARWHDVLATEQRHPSAPSAALYAAERLRQAQEREQRPERPTLMLAPIDSEMWED
jgi:hypothetical protein